MEAGSRLRQASTHWLRHSFATRSLAHMLLKHVQLLMGHGDIAITGECISVEAEALREAIERAFANVAGVAVAR
jgi:site-specific recombinase XerD